MEAHLISLLLVYRMHAKFECQLRAVTVRITFIHMLFSISPWNKEMGNSLSEQTWIYKAEIGGRNSSSEKM